MTNDRYGIPNRENEALPGATEKQDQDVRQLALKQLGTSFQMAMDFEKLFGLRCNESFAFRAHRITDALSTVIFEMNQQDGTKGGRYRQVPVETEAQRELLQRAFAYGRGTGKTASDRLLTGREKGAVHKARAKMARFYVNNRDMLGPISAHSMRRAYAQGLYDLTPGTDADRMATVCRALGHGSNRDDITGVYVADRHAW